jgi:coiled-coil domain-containing protein 130
MGVRYNAEKKKVGNYYSTPVYQFRMKCHLCDGYFEIKTDPANLDYEIISGARRQENRWDPTQNEQIVPETKEAQRRMFDDAMYKLEHGAKDEKAAEDAKPVISKLYQRNDDVWKDNFEANSKLRAEFRKKKKEIKAAEEADNKVLTRTSLQGITLLPETVEDRQLASLLQLRAGKSIAEKSRERMLEVMNKPALPSATVTSFGGTRREKLLAQKLKPTSLGIVKKRDSNGNESEPSTKKCKSEITAVSSLVAAYSSSSEEEANS